MTAMPEDTIIHRELNKNARKPTIQVTEAVADIEGKEATDLPNMWDQMGGVLDRMFSTSPAPDAQLVVQFSYHGYRITIEQNGRAKFAKLNNCSSDPVL